MNVFLVESPLQYLNAKSAKFYWKIDKKDTLLILNINGNEVNKKQLMYLVKNDTAEWGNVEKIESKSIYKRFQILKRIIRSSKCIQRIFIGDYNSALFRSIANFSGAKEQILLDDGTATIAIYEKIMDNSPISTQNFFKRFLKKCIGFNDNKVDKATFFTVYEELGTTEKYKIILNKYDFIKEIDNHFKRERYKLFLGAPLPERNVMKEEDYLKYIYKYKSKISEKMVYVPHRNEGSDKLKKISDMGIDIIKLNTAIEFELLIGTLPLPNQIISFYSSALINFKYILSGEEIDIATLYINPKYIFEEHRENVAGKYKYLQKELTCITL